MTEIKLTEKEKFAIQVALAELRNCGDWAEYIEDDAPATVDEIFEAMDTIKEKLNTED